MTKGQPDWAIRTTDGGLTWKPASPINRPNVAVQGVALVRGANSGVWSVGMVGHVLVLTALSVVALRIASRRLDTLLRK